TFSDRPFGEVKVWDVAAGREKLTLQAHTERVTAVAFNQKGDRLASASLDGTVRIWDVTEKEGKEVRTLRGNGGGGGGCGRGRGAGPVPILGGDRPGRVRGARLRGG